MPGQSTGSFNLQATRRKCKTVCRFSLKFARIADQIPFSDCPIVAFPSSSLMPRDSIKNLVRIDSHKLFFSTHLWYLKCKNKFAIRELARRVLCVLSSRTTTHLSRRRPTHDHANHLVCRHLCHFRNSTHRSFTVGTRRPLCRANARRDIACSLDHTQDEGRDTG